MKKGNIMIPFESEQLTALEFSLKKKNTSVQAQLEELLKCLYESEVPRFGNYEGLLPEADGRTYTECDIDTLGADSRGAKRIVFSNDGLIYYTEDHYKSFELLYGEE